MSIGLGMVLLFARRSEHGIVLRADHEPLDFELAVSALNQSFERLCGLYVVGQLPHKRAGKDPWTRHRATKAYAVARAHH
jgi:hypothetical protein